jgi:hypothetical protein
MLTLSANRTAPPKPSAHSLRSRHSLRSCRRASPFIRQGQHRYRYSTAAATVAALRPQRTDPPSITVGEHW